MSRCSVLEPLITPFFLSFIPEWTHLRSNHLPAPDNGNSRYNPLTEKASGATQKAQKAQEGLIRNHE